MTNDFDAHDDDDLYGDLYDVVAPHRADLEDDSGPVDTLEDAPDSEPGDMYSWEDHCHEVDDCFDF